MQITIVETVEKEVKYLKCDMQPRYWEDGKVNGVEDSEGDLIPLRSGDMWKITIDLDEGRILDWPSGTTAKVYYKVCDAGIYSLLDSDKKPVLTLNDLDLDYVPSCIGEYGDYVNLEINEEGFIKDWNPNSLIDEIDDAYVQ